MRFQKLALIGSVALLGHTSHVLADYTFPAFNIVPFEDGSNDPYYNAASSQLTGAPAGTYYTYSVTVDWSANFGDPYSSEAVAALGDQPQLPSTGDSYYFIDFANTGAFFDSDPTTLTWSGTLTTPYVSGNPLYFLGWQQFEGSSAFWDNVTVTLGDTAPAAPTATAVVQDSSTPGVLTDSTIDWYTFVYVGGELVIDTEGSLAEDTEIGVYTSAGLLVDNDDDSGTGLLSSLTFLNGELTLGETYYIAVGGFNTVFAGGGWGATSDSDVTGDYLLNLTTTVPEPTSLAVVGFAAAGLLARRRRA